VVRTVLIVDDEKEMLQMLRRAFEAYQEVFSVRIATDGEEALEVLRESSDVSLVVTDLIMPKMDGFTLLVHIRSDFPHIPVIIMTAHSRPVMERMAWKIGVAEYIEKPFDVEELARKILEGLHAGEDRTGGGIQDMGIALFTQLIELERKTCTIHVKNHTANREGELYFLDGDLVNAHVEDLSADAAAREILRWPEVDISLHDGCAEKERRINSSIEDLISPASS
jgi:CheY-like chemotaxis protein